jgi:two-component system response regulator RegX3
VSGRILVVEDEAAIARAVSYALGSEGFSVEAAADGTTGLERGLGGAFDLVILDVGLPGLSGREVCRRLRAESDIPILMLTARATDADEVLGLEIGADDYVTKPFSMPALLGRVRAILRRRELDRAASTPDVRRVGGLEIDLRTHRVVVDGAPVHVTRSELRLLSILSDEPGRVFSRREIMQELWGSEHVGDAHACEVHVSKLRSKIEADAAAPARLLTVRGAGYKLVAA